MGDEKRGVHIEIGGLTAQRDAIVAGVIHELHIHHDGDWREEEPFAPPPLLEDRVCLPAIAALKRRDTCVYLGGRYGLTPHSRAPRALFDGVELGMRPPQSATMGEAMTWLAEGIGLAAAKRHLAEVYSTIDPPAAEIVQELNALAPLLQGHFVATGTWSAQIQRVLGPHLELVSGRPQGQSGRTRLLMLHGSEQSFQTALVAQDDVAEYQENGAALSAAAVDQLLQSVWVVLGARRATDATFLMMARRVSKGLGEMPRPIFVVDPRPLDEVSREWPKGALRHIRMTPGAFITKAGLA